uniref:Uncharacterized protein n=1 Tax=Ralstonia solanacearum TaxID=305 RepID=A0A0S4U108_RALSL|nr:protein of unknown function [Ralstonia solanacearum]
MNWSESYPNRYAAYFFGDYPSFKAGDAYDTMLAGYFDLNGNWAEPVSNLNTDSVYSVGTGVGNTGIWLARGYSQLGGRINAQWVGAPAGNGGTLSLIHISEPTRQEAISYAVFCLKKKTSPRD